MTLRRVSLSLETTSLIDREACHASIDDEIRLGFFGLNGGWLMVSDRRNG